MAPLRDSRQRKPYARPRGSDGAWLHDRAPLSSARGNNANPSGTVPNSALNTKLVVSNLHYEITPKDLVSIFGQIGTLVREPLIRAKPEKSPFTFKYDRSGRSSGVAIITYDKPAEATRAKKEFEGKLAKGQPLEIAFDTAPLRRVRSASMPGNSTASLLNRIERPSLAERLGGSDDNGQLTITGPSRARAPRPVRGGAASRSKAGRPTRLRPKTAEELDKELDFFMADDGKDASVDSEKVAEPVAAPQDVEMA